MLLKKGSQGLYVKSWQEFLISVGYDLNPDGIFGEKTRKATSDFQKNNNLADDGIVGEKTIELAKSLGYVDPITASTGEISIEQLEYVMTGAKKQTLETHLPLINDCMNFFEINTSLRIQHFLAQVGHESASLKYMHEIASGSAYEGRTDLGNTQPGDGKKFRGHGPIQLTGRANHKAFFDYIGKPELIETPEILETDLGLAWKASGWFWMSRNLNSYADLDNIKKITKIINGGYNGLTDREAYLKRAKEVII